MFVETLLKASISGAILVAVVKPFSAVPSTKMCTSNSNVGIISPVSLI
jgi:hypothetical protein